MDSFDSLEELVEERKRHFHMLIKFGSKENLEKRVGQEVEVLIEDKAFDGKTYVGRTYMDVPEIDGIVYVNAGDKELQIGEFVKGKIIDVSEYDLIVRI